MPEPEAWLRGPVPGVSSWLQPVAHAFLQVVEDVDGALADLSDDEIRATPGGAASVAFHCHHLAGSIDRLLAYARGEKLTAAHIEAMKSERDAAASLGRAELLERVRTAVEGALRQVRETPDESLAQARAVGRAGLPSTALGLFFHAAEHATRHAGQAITTAKIVRGLRKDCGAGVASAG
jgi:uncharacterized damage-inducible protein DinB